jgi:hypothetical protein
MLLPRGFHLFCRKTLGLGDVEVLEHLGGTFGKGVFHVDGGARRRDVEGLDAVSYMKGLGCKNDCRAGRQQRGREKKKSQARSTRESQRRLEVLPFGGAKRGV